MIHYTKCHKADFRAVAAGFGREGVEDALEVGGDFHTGDFNRKRPPSPAFPQIRRKPVGFGGGRKGARLADRTAVVPALSLVEGNFGVKRGHGFTLGA